MAGHSRAQGTPQRVHPWGGRIVFSVYAAVVLAFLLAPVLVALAMSFSSGEQLVFPPAGFSLRWYRKALGNSQFLSGFRQSLVIALAVSVIATAAGTLAAVAVNHFMFPGRQVLRTFLLLPLVVPAVVLGLGNLQVLGSYGLGAGTLAAVLGHSVITIPYVAYLVLASLSNYDLALDHASLSLGANRVETFLRVTLPLIRPGVVAGATFAFLLSFDNVALSIFVTRGDTLPLRLMQHIQFYADPSVAAVSAFLVCLSLPALLAMEALLRRRGGFQLM